LFEMESDQFWPNYHYSGIEWKARPVGLSVVVRQISGVDIVSHSFNVNLLVYMDWPATQDECEIFWNTKGDQASVVSAGTSKDETWESLFVDYQPWRRFRIVAKEQEMVDPWIRPQLCWVYSRQKYYFKTTAVFRATCLEPFELERFPMDVQDLTMRIVVGRGARGINRYQVVPSSTRPVILKISRQDCVLEEFDLTHSYCYLENTDPKESTVGMSLSTFVVNLKITRQWSSYFYRIALILSFISFVTLACFFIDADDFPDRVAHISTMLLTGVAFMFIVYTTLPAIPYLTYMDYYTNLQFIFMALLLVAVCFEKGTGEDWGNKPLHAFGLGWVGLHVVIFTWFAIGHHVELKRLEFDPQALEVKGQSTLLLKNEKANWHFGKRFPKDKFWISNNFATE